MPGDIGGRALCIRSADPALVMLWPSLKSFHSSRSVSRRETGSRTNPSGDTETMGTRPHPSPLILAELQAGAGASRREETAAPLLSSPH